MESTGIYWKSVYAALEEAGIPAYVVNARHLKNVPGRKTDIADSEWLAQLGRFGLVCPSFIPPTTLQFECFRVSAPHAVLPAIVGRYQPGVSQSRQRLCQRVVRAEKRRSSCSPRPCPPSSPSAVGTGSVGDAVGATPVAWPQTEYQVRYWSIANNVYKKPYPVVTFGRGKRVVYGGAPDLSTPLDTEGRYNVAISHPADKPKNATADNGIAWLPTQVNKPRAWETLIMRNMLPNSGFANAIQQIPSSNYGDPAAAQSVMGSYYPSIASCSRAVFEKGGPDACFIAYQGRR